MKLAWTAVVLGALCFTKSAVAQAQPPKVLLQILHCAETDKFGLLPPATKKDDKLEVAWAHKVRYEPYVMNSSSSAIHLQQKATSWSIPVNTPTAKRTSLVLTMPGLWLNPGICS